MIDREGKRGTGGPARAGLLQIGLLVAAAVLVFFLDEIRRATEEGPRVTVVAEAAPGLQPGSDVWVAGRPVGRVLSVRLRPPEADRAEHVVVRAVLHRTTEGVIRADATATIRAADLLEPMVVSVDPGSPGRPPFDFRDTLRAISDRIDQERVLGLADTLRRAGEELARHAADVRREVAGRRGTLVRLREDPRAVAEVTASLRGVLSLMDGFERGTLGRLVGDSSLSRRVARIRDRLTAVADPSTAGERETLGSVLTRLGALGDRIADLSATLERGEGTAGRALLDGELPRQASLLRARLDSVLAELATQPGRWLRVRIF